ncbi:MAG: hypothetical protein NZL91_05185 [Thermoflexales bacterium]|nr:hypothetical protein [Thermoflexales bacterium]MCS7324601.1 hypothetical protein [Thermoflexales bacterium]MCX7940079.1 hypothetical protein [Thermoflexales bacterium]MDW8053852.1 hypothetical protein [Anaerolineae bacterium]MDW8292383.1 hypothetical protein [Anaerolineae bacterium]
MTALVFQGKGALVEALREARETLDRQLAMGLVSPNEALRAAAWDAVAEQAIRVTQVVTLLFRIERGAVSKPLAPIEVDAKALAEQRARPQERLLADFRNAHAQLLRRLESWRDENILFERSRLVAPHASLAAWIWHVVGKRERELAAQFAAMSNERN